ncbi:hypothetical protein GQ53DRAFT_37270 [Thozetella sp. PMI_491]|nr:hypothetical protein GQ53DRAFT_37270 [Thozetella sp. PMI_491]
MPKHVEPLASHLTSTKNPKSKGLPGWVLSRFGLSEPHSTTYLGRTNMDAGGRPPRQRRSHNKSRNGCQRCKSRRIKVRIASICPLFNVAIHFPTCSRGATMPGPQGHAHLAVYCAWPSQAKLTSSVLVWRGAARLWQLFAALYSLRFHTSF